MKKILQKALALMVSVCMVCTLTPALAWGARPTSSDVGNLVGVDNSVSIAGTRVDGQINPSTGKVEGDSGTGLATGATTAIWAHVYEITTGLVSISESANYATPEEALQALAAAPITATVEKMMDGYQIIWTIQDVTVGDRPRDLKKETYHTANPAGDDREFVLDGEGAEEGKSVGELIRGVLTAPNHKYQITAALVDKDGNSVGSPSSRSMIISTFGNYADKILYANVDSLDGVVSPPPDGKFENMPSTISVTGMIVKGATLQEKPVGPTDPDEIYASLTNKAANEGDGYAVNEASSLQIIGFEEKDLAEGEGPYLNKMTGTLPLDLDFYQEMMGKDATPEEDNAIPVFWYNPTDPSSPKKLDGKVKHATVEPDGADAWVVEFEGIEGTGVSGNLGAFAIGYPSLGRFTISTAVEGPGSISPSEQRTYWVGSSPTYTTNAVVAGYVLSDVTLSTVSGDNKSIMDQVEGNTISLPSTNASLGLVKGANATLTVIYEPANEVNPDIGDYYTVTVIQENDASEGIASGKTTVDYTAVEFNDGVKSTKPKTATVEKLGDDNPFSDTMDSTAGVTLTISPDKDAAFKPTCTIKAVEVNSVPVEITGSTYFISVLTRDTTIKVIYGEGEFVAPTKTFDVTASAEHGVICYDAEGASQTGPSYTFKPVSGGILDIVSQPDEDYILDSVKLYPGGNKTSANAVDITEQAHLDTTEAGGKQYTVHLSNIISNMAIDFAYKLDATTLTVGVDKDSSGHGTVSFGSGDAEMLQNAEREITATPAPNYLVGELNLTDSEGTTKNLSLFGSEDATEGAPNHELNPDGETPVTVDSTNNVAKVTLVRDSNKPFGSVGKVGEKVVVYINGPRATLTVTFYDDGGSSADAFVTVNAKVGEDGNGAGGTVSPQSTTLPVGGTVEISVFPNEGMMIDSVTVGGEQWTDAQITEIRGKSQPVITVEATEYEDIEVVVTFITREDSAVVPSSETVKVFTTPGPNGSISPKAPVNGLTVYKGKAQTFYFKPADGYKLNHVYLEQGGAFSMIPDTAINKEGDTTPYYYYTLSNIQSDTTISASFIEDEADLPATFKIKVEAGPNGSVDPKGSQDVPNMLEEGTLEVVLGVQKVTITPNEGYVIDKITYTPQGGTAQNIEVKDNGAAGTYNIPVTADGAILATFKVGTTEPGPEQKYVVVPGKNFHINGSGAVLSPPGAVIGDVKVPADPTDESHAKESQTFTVQLFDSYRLDPDNPVVVNGKTVELTPVSSQDGTYTFIVPKEDVTSGLTVTVNTQVKSDYDVPTGRQAINIRILGSGQVTPSQAVGADPTNRVTYVKDGGSQTLSFIPDPTYKLQSVLVNGALYTSDTAVEPVKYTYKFNEVTEAQTVYVTFAKLGDGETQPPLPKDYTVNILTDNVSHGTITPALTPIKVFEGADLSFTAFPSEGYEVDAYIGALHQKPENLEISGNTVTLKNISKDYSGPEGSLHISFVEKEVNRYVNLGVWVDAKDTTTSSKGSVSPCGQISGVANESSQTISIKPEANYTLDKITVNGETEKKTDPAEGITEADLAFTFVVDGDTDVVVTFREKKTLEPFPSDVTYHRLTVDYIGGGAVSPELVENALHNSANTFTLKPDTNYEVGSVVINGVEQLKSAWASGQLVVTADGNKNIAVSFVRTLPVGDETFYTIAVVAETDNTGNEANPSAIGGRVSPSSAVRVQAGNSQPFSIFTMLNYHAELACVEGDASTVIPASMFTPWTSATYNAMSVSSNRVLKVRFVYDGTSSTQTPLSKHIEATAGPNGDISPSGSVEVAQGGSAAFNFIPGEGYEVDYVRIDGNGGTVYQSGNPAIAHNSYKFTNVTANHKIFVAFKAEGATPSKFVTVSVPNTTNGSITRNGSIVSGTSFSVDSGSDLEFTIAPDATYDIDQIAVTAQDGTSVDFVRTGSVIKIHGVEKNINVSATFKKVQSGTETNPAPSYTTLTTIVNSDPDAPGKGKLSVGPGKFEIEQIASDSVYDITVKPDENCIAGAITIEPNKGVKRTIGKTGVPSIYDVYKSGSFSLTAAELNAGATVTVTFRQMTETELGNHTSGELPSAQYVTLNVEKSGSGEVTPLGSNPVATGSSQTINFSPHAGFKLTNVTVNNNPVMDEVGIGSATEGTGAPSYMYVLNIPLGATADYSVRVTFESAASNVDTYKVTTSVDSAGAGGTVFPATIEAPAGENVNIYIKPDTGNVIDTITVTSNGQGTNVITDHESPLYVVKLLSADTDVKVKFRQADSEKGDDTTPFDEAEMCKFNVSIGEGGHGKVSPTGDIEVPKDSIQNIYFYPESGYIADSVVVDGVEHKIGAGKNSYQLQGIDSAKAHTVVVNFTPINATEDRSDVDVDVNVEVDVDVQAKVIVDEVTTEGAGCEVDPMSTTVHYGGSASFFIYPTPGWAVVRVDYDGASNIDVVGVDGDVTDTKYVWDSAAHKWTTSKAVKTYATDSPLSTFAVRSTRSAFDDNAAGVFYSTYQATMSEVTASGTLHIGMKPISEIMKDKDGNVEDFTLIGCETKTLTVQSVGGGSVSPVGQMRIPKGYDVEINTSAFNGYYLASVTKTKGGVDTDITKSVVNDGFSVTVDDDMTITVEYLMLNQDSLVNVRLANAFVAQYNDDGTIMMDGDKARYDSVSSLANVSFGTRFNKAEKKVINGTRDSQGYLMGSNGKRAGFVRDGSYTFYFQYNAESPVEGQMWALDSVRYNKVWQPLNDSYSTLATLPITGDFDVRFKLVDDPDYVEKFTIEPKVVAGQGAIDPSEAVDVAPGGEAEFTFAPAEGWLVDKVELVKLDEDGKEINRKTLSRADYEKNGVYLYTLTSVDADYRIEVSFVQGVRIYVDWDNSKGYITPNPDAKTRYILIESGTAIPFLIAPYADSKGYYDVSKAEFGTSSMSDADKNIMPNLKQDKDSAAKLQSATKLQAVALNHGAGVGVFKDSATSKDDSSDENDSKKSTDEKTSAVDLETMALPYDLSDIGANSKPLGTSFQTVYKYVTPELKVASGTTRAANDYTLDVEFVRTNNETPVSSYTLTASVDGDGGKVIPTQFSDVPAGQSRTFSFVPDSGYTVAMINVDGAGFDSYRAATYTFSDVQADHNVVVKFARQVGSGSGIDRTLRTIGSMVKTGDLNTEILVGLLAIAALGLGVSIWSVIRRNKRNKRASR